MADTEIRVTKKSKTKGGGAGGVWFLGFLGALVYYLHTHSGTLWLVLIAVLKAVFWPAFLVYHLLQLRI
jgi:hypothetical protein